MTSAPSRERRRLTAPISTPRAVESRNEVSVRSTTIRDLPPSIASVSFCLSSGAVNRSISPRTATTWRSGSSDSSVRANSGGMSGGLWQAWGAERRPGRSGGERQLQRQYLAAVVAAGDGDLVGDALEHVADPRQRGVGGRCRRAARPRPPPLRSPPPGRPRAAPAPDEPHGDVAVGGVRLGVGGDGVGDEQ